MKFPIKLNLQIDKEVKELLEQASKEKKLSISAYIRGLIIRDKRSET